MALTPYPGPYQPGAYPPHYYHPYAHYHPYFLHPHHPYFHPYGFGYGHAIPYGPGVVPPREDEFEFRGKKKKAAR
ncbi:hypothetical protein [Cohnella caldifontis]|uniref:hypothetical protein n=1 Tax=Cohnella caldifontis TaxID=3027471 RepID=UPI0023ED402D|nr:hypothetical protein [Cohnella sp. YIM B05605]